MVADKGKKSKVVETGQEDDSDHIDGELVLSIEKLQEIQDELEKVLCFVSFSCHFLLNVCNMYICLYHCKAAAFRWLLSSNLMVHW